MKTPFAFCAMLAAVWVSAAQAAWQYHLPESGLLPSAASYSFLAPAGERHHGGDSLGLQTAEMTIPFADPRRSNIDDWYINACLDMEFDHLSGAHALRQDAQNLYTFTLPLSFIHPMQNGHRLILTAAPHLATDFNGSAHAFGMGGYAVYRFCNTEKLEASVGVVCMPNETYYWFVPIAAFDWKPTQDWCVSLKGFRLQAMRAMGRGLSLGAFARGIGGSWATHGEQGTRLLRVRSLAAGGRAEWDFSKPGQTKRLLFADAGFSFFTAAETIRYSDKRHTESMHHYHPAPYVSFGADFRF